MLISEFKTSKYSNKKLYEIFKLALTSSGYIICNETSDVTDKMSVFDVVDKDNRRIKVHALFRNISNSGWIQKPEIKRIQIPKLPTFPRQRKDEIYILCGVAEYNGEVILVIWNPNNYRTHETVCSCYVFFSSFEKADKVGFFNGINEGKEVMVCKSNHLDSLLSEYTSRYL